MKVCVDVYYTDNSAIAAAVAFADWSDSQAIEECLHVAHDVQPYVPGQFFKRELPPVLAVISEVTHPIDTIVIDGYVWLDDATTPGLGAYLFGALHGRVAVIGVAKNRYRQSTVAVEVHRGASERPLFVTAAGMAPTQAADRIRDMHGEFRIPSLLKRVDRLGRDVAETLTDQATGKLGFSEHSSPRID